MHIGYSRSVDPASKLGKIMLSGFLALGLIFLAVAVVLAVTKTAKLKRYVTTEAEIRHLDYENFPTVTDQVAGEIYTKRLNTSSQSYRIGDKIRIAYDPAEPDQVTNAGFMGYLASVILGFLGIVFTFVGGFVLLKLHPKKKPEAVPWES